ncbi:MAG TPA: hypothetical protein VNV86_17640 [Candidatus Acidoferrum sp.]|nr:hypothetical protein [Candidatus Acidoferrum sp.]
MLTFRIAASLFFFTSMASGTVLTLTPSTQAVTFTGLGTNATGAGTTRVSWGSCVYDGQNSTCTVSGAYTGVGTGGVYRFVLQYPGNGPSPLTTVASPPGSDLVYFQLAAGTFGFTITPNGGSPVTFYNLRFNLAYSPGTSSCTVVTVCGVGAVGTTPGGTITGPLSGSFDATPLITAPGGVITASAYGSFPTIAPATWIEIYGQNLATTLMQTWSGADFDGIKAPTSLGGTTVTVGGKSAFVDYVSPNQVNVQVPSGIGSGPQPVVVTTFGGSSLAFNVTVNAVEPGILAPAAFRLAAGQYAVALFPDGITYVLPPGVAAGVPTARAKPGDTIILYGVGFGPVTPDIAAGNIVQQNNSLPGFQASFGGVPATVSFAGLVQGFLGLYQFNVVIPKVTAGDAVPFTFSLNGSAGRQTLLVPIGN